MAGADVLVLRTRHDDPEGHTQWTYQQACERRWELLLGDGLGQTWKCGHGQVHDGRSIWMSEPGMRT